MPDLRVLTQLKRRSIAVQIAFQYHYLIPAVLVSA